jgi:hypothetical protein
VPAQSDPSGCGRYAGSPTLFAGAVACPNATNSHRSRGRQSSNLGTTNGNRLNTSQNDERGAAGDQYASPFPIRRSRPLPASRPDRMAEANELRRFLSDEQCAKRGVEGVLLPGQTSEVC